MLHKIKRIIIKYDYIFGKYRYKIRELLNSKKPGTFSTQAIPFKGSIDILPEMKAAFLSVGENNNYSYNAFRIDCVDFNSKQVKRYNLAGPYISKIINISKRDVAVKNMPKGISHESFFQNETRIPHTGHMTPNGIICATLAYCLYIIDTTKNRVYLLNSENESKLMLYSSTGSFSSDFKYFYFVRWSFEDSIKILKEEQNYARCEICRAKLEDRSVEKLYELDYIDNVHQILCTRDDKYLVIVNFDFFPAISYHKNVSTKEIENHAVNKMTGSKIITYDIENKTHWETKLQIPTAAHFQFDPIDPHVFYASVIIYFIQLDLVLYLLD